MGRHTAYRGRMPHVTTTDLTTPSGSVPIPSIGFGVWQVPDAEVDAAMDEHVANEARLLAGLEPDERAALGELLGRLATTLGV